MECLAYRMPCLIGETPRVYREGQHDQRAPLYGGYNNLSIKILTEILEFIPIRL